MLTLAERNAFSPWLDECVRRSGKTKLELATALGADSTQRVNRYLAGGQIPTAHIVAKIAQVIGVPWPVAIWRAGHFSDLLGVIDRLDRCYRGHHDVSDDDARASIVGLAMTAFPFPCETADLGHSGDELDFDPLAAQLGEMDPPDKRGFLNITRGLNPFFTAAVRELEQPRIPSDVKREVAGVFVNRWADNDYPVIAARLRKTRRFATDLLTRIGPTA